MIIVPDPKLLKSLLMLAAVVEARDPYTGGHLWRMSRFVWLLGERIGLSEDELIQLSLGGFVHDIGKIGVAEAILAKGDHLTDAEYAAAKTHAAFGAQLINDHPLADLFRDIIHYHHERQDGSGYPEGLADDAIPLHCRIIAIVDTFDALTSTRPYRRGMPIAQALHRLAQQRDRQFDGALIEHFLALGTDSILDAIVRHSDDGIPLVNCDYCGPVIAVRHSVNDGDFIFCRVCGREFRLHRGTEAFVAEPTGGHGTVQQLQLVVDERPIDDLVRLACRPLEIKPPIMGR